MQTVGEKVVFWVSGAAMASLGAYVALRYPTVRGPVAAVYVAGILAAVSSVPVLCAWAWRRVMRGQEGEP